MTNRRSIDRPPESRPIWLVRAGREGRYIGDFEEAEVVGLGWKAAGVDVDLPKDDLVALVRAAYPGSSKKAAMSGASQLIRWRDEVTVGDGVVSYDRDRRRYLLGEIASDLRYDEEALPELPRVRSVSWTGHVPKDVLSEGVQNSLSTLLTLTKTRDDVAAELLRYAVPLDRSLEEAAGLTNSPDARRHALTGRRSGCG
ncbi:hypothetical protein [Alienimonas sp. DA493]|uniref:hypothetical protein n=1 Tax=Alienimonas sp. DA493 TaxID=3373605 RepID=UPI003754FA7D